MTPSTAAIRVRIEGRVQGVTYRAWTLREAQARGLTGWVRNRSDGSVEALFCGSLAALDDMLAACRRGPPKAWVTQVTADSADPPAKDGFEKWPTL